MLDVEKAGKNFTGRMVEKRQRELHIKLMPAVIEASKNFKSKLYHVGPATGSDETPHYHYV
jgi:hypothetical protein